MASTRRVRFTPTTGLLIAIVILLIVGLWLSGGNMLTPPAMSTYTPLLVFGIIVALGQSLVIGTGGIDLSVPFTITLVGAIILDGSNMEASRLPGAIVVALIACAVIGLVNGILVQTFGLNALVATLSVGLVVEGITRLYRGPIQNVTSVPEVLQSFARSNVFGVSLLFLVAIAAIVLLSLYTLRTVRGRRLVASSTSLRASYLLGFWSRSYRVLAYVLAAILYGVAGVLVGGFQGSPDLTLGDPFLLAPIVAVVLGGAALSGGRIHFVPTALGAIFIVLLAFVLKVAGQGSGVAMFVQGLVLAGGLAAINFARQRRTTTSSGKSPVQA